MQREAVEGRLPVSCELVGAAIAKIRINKEQRLASRISDTQEDIRRWDGGSRRCNKASAEVTHARWAMGEARMGVVISRGGGGEEEIRDE